MELKKNSYFSKGTHLEPVKSFIAIALSGL